MSMEANERYLMNAETLDELYAWIDSIPLSRPKKNIARDFADGVLVAEIVQYFLPKMVEMHNYFPASAIGQKKINWTTLNRKVFAKMGIKINDNVINKLTEANPGTIEQVLWDLRRAIAEQPAENRGPKRSKPNSYSNRPSSASQVHAARTRNSTTGYIAPPAGVLYSRDSQLSSIGSASHVNTPQVVSSYQQQQHYQSTPMAHSSGSYNESLVPPLSVFQESNNGSYMTQQQQQQQPTPHPPPQVVQYSASHQQYSTPQPPQINYGHGQSQGSVVVDQNCSQNYVCAAEVYSVTPANNNNNNGTGPPAQIIYRGHKMIPLVNFEEKDRELKKLEYDNKNYASKISRLENLVQIKEERIEDLTHQLRTLRTIYEKVTTKAWEST